MSVELHRGKLAKSPVIRGIRPLTKDDLTRLRATRVQPRIKHLRESHHRLARYVAQGMRTEEICSITGYSPTRLGTLKTDPAFRQLVEEYRGKVTEAWVADEVNLLASETLVMGERLINERVAEAMDGGEAISLKDLCAIVGDRMDRFGYPKKKVTEGGINDFAKRLEQMMTIKGKAPVIDGKRTPLLPSPGLDGAPHPSSPDPDQSAVVPAGVVRQL